MYFKRLIRLYKVIVKDFLENTTLHGFRALLRDTPYSHGKTLWKYFLIVTILVTHYGVMHLLLQFLDQPTEVHMSPHLVHISNTPFPCISICSSNKISKKKLEVFADTVFKHQQKVRPNYVASNTTQMYEYLQALGFLYAIPHKVMPLKPDILQKVDRVLQSLYNATTVDSRKLLTQLAPDCQSLVQRAFLFGKPANVSDIFHSRMTRYGLCCMFNYRRSSISNDPVVRKNDQRYVDEARKMRFESSSSLNGLHFVLEQENDDFAFQHFASDAFQLYVFPPYDYAMPMSSHRGQMLVDGGQILEIPIQPLYTQANRAIRQYSPAKRNCYYPDEGRTFLNLSYYSLDECLLMCEMRSMQRFCGCVVPNLSGMLIGASRCTLSDLVCVEEWKKRWYDMDFFDYVLNDQPNTMMGDCFGCLPNCNDVSYKLFPSVQPIRRTVGEAYTYGLLAGKTSDKMLAIVKLYFKSLFEQETEKDVRGDWVVYLNRFGGILSLIFGFGIVSYIEVLYYFSGKWGVMIYRTFGHKRTETSPEAAIKSEPHKDKDASTVYTLYWRELRPKRLLHESYLLHKYRWPRGEEVNNAA